MASTPTANFAYNKPAQGDTDWDTTINNDWDALDADLNAEHTHTGGVAVHGGTKKNRAQVVADATALAAISSPLEGNFAFQSDIDALFVYDGAAWDQVGGGTGGGYVTGKVWLGATALWPSTTNGCASAAKTEFGTNDVDLYTLDFDTAADEHCQIGFAMPHDWDAGTVTFQFHWTTAGGSAAQTVRWAGQGRAYADDDAVDQAWGTAVLVDDTRIANDDIHISATSSACTLAGGPAAGEYIQLRFYRDVSGDDLSVDAKLIGVMMTFTRS